MVILITGLSNTAIRRLNARYGCPTPKLTAYVCPPNFQTEMYAGHVACCPLVSHGGYADETDRWTDGRTDGHQTVILCFPLDAVSVIT